MTGRHLSRDETPNRAVWLDAFVLKERIALKKRLLDMSIADYGRERISYLQTYATRWPAP